MQGLSRRSPQPPPRAVLAIHHAAKAGRGRHEHGRDQLTGGEEHQPRLDPDRGGHVGGHVAVLARVGLLEPAVEEIGNVGILFRFGKTQLANSPL